MTISMMKSSPSSLPKERIKLLKKGGFLFFMLLGLASIFVLLDLYSPNPFSTRPKQQDLNQRTLLIQHNKDDDDDHDDENHSREEACDLFVGRWIPEPRGPLYTNRSCATIPDSKNCGKYGRVDKGYMNWRWKPNGCELPRFDAKTFLGIVRGKKLAFIGDSVARNQMESLLCLLSQIYGTCGNMKLNLKGSGFVGVPHTRDLAGVYGHLACNDGGKEIKVTWDTQWCIYNIHTIYPFCENTLEEEFKNDSYPKLKWTASQLAVRMVILSVKAFRRAYQLFIFHLICSGGYIDMDEGKIKYQIDTVLL